MITLFVLEDHFIVVKGLNSIFRSTTEPIKISGYSNRINIAIEEIHRSPVDVIIFDLFLNRVDPILTFRKLKSEFPSIPIMILTKENSLYWKTRMFMEGAHGYLVKDCLPSTIKQIIRLIADGNIVISSEVSDMVKLWRVGNGEYSLMEQDLELVYSLSCGLNPKQLTSSLNKSLSSIEKMISSLRSKVNAKTNYELIRIFFERD
jgi:DNA-binding NarL/FixJ family response regulator